MGCMQNLRLLVSLECTYIHIIAGCMIYSLAMKLVEEATNYFGYSFDLSCTNDML